MHEFAPSVANESPQWVDLLGDGRKGVLCGSQPEGAIVWITPGTPPKFPPHTIDDASSVGTQFEVADVDGDGRLDVAISNKKGVFVFVQQPR